MKKDKIISFEKFKSVSVTSSEKSKGLSYYNEGLLFYEKENYKKAMALFLKAEKTGFTSVDMFCNMSWMYGEKKSCSRLAMDYAKKALKLDEVYGRPYLLIGNVYYWQKDGYDKALEYYLKAEALDYLDTYTARRMSMIYSDKHNKMKVLEYALKAYKMNKEDSESIRYLADVYYFQDENYKKAHEYYKKYFELGGELDWILYCCVSVCYCASEDFKKALLYANKAALLNRTDPFVYYRKGVAYWGMDDFDNAEKEFLKAEKLGSKEIDLYYRLAYIYCEIKHDNDKFVEYIKKTLKYDPHWAEAIYAYAYYLFDELKDYKQALKLYKKALKYMKEPFRPEFYQEMAQMYLCSHKYKLAKERLEKGLEIYPDNEVLKEMLSSIKK